MPLSLSVFVWTYWSMIKGRWSKLITNSFLFHKQSNISIRNYYENTCFQKTKHQILLPKYDIYHYKDQTHVSCHSSSDLEICFLVMFQWNHFSSLSINYHSQLSQPKWASHYHHNLFILFVIEKIHFSTYGTKMQHAF